MQNADRFERDKRRLFRRLRNDRITGRKRGCDLA